MKAWIQSLNREQIACGASVALAVVLLLAGVAGGPASPPDALPQARSREHKPLPSLQLRAVDADFEKYWSGRNVFLSENTTQLPIPAIAAPMPRAENPSVPLFRPTPALDVYNRAVKVKYPGLQAKPLVTDADLPAAELLEAVRKIEEPPVTPFKDASEDRERALCEYFFTTDVAPKQGECSGGCGRAEDSKEIRIRQGQSTLSFKREQIREIRHRWRNIEQYEYRTKKLVRAPAEADRRVELAQWCWDRGMLEPAKLELQKTLELKRDHAKAIQMLGQILEDEGNFDGAIGHYQLSAEGAPALREELWWRVGEALRRIGLFEAALEAYGKSILSPLSFRGKISQARMLVEIGEYAKAVEIVNDADKYKGDTKNYTPELRTLAHLSRGRARLMTGDLAQAAADLEAAGKAGSAEAWNALGACQAFEGKWKDAAASFVAALQADQYQLEAWTNLAFLYLLAGKTGEADAILAKAVQRDPAGMDAAAGQALSLLLAGKFPEATKRIEEALAIDPSHAYAKYLQGDLALRAGTLDAALAASRAALRRQPQFLPAYYSTGAACLRSAEAALGEAARLAPALEGAEHSAPVLGPLWSSVLRDQLRQAPEAHRAGAREDVVRAETLFRELSAVDPRRVNLQIALACAHLLLRQPEKAAPALEVARGVVRDSGMRADPIVEYALGYLQYHFGTEDAARRLPSARKYFDDASKSKDYPDAGSLRFIQEAAAVVRKIDEWIVTAVVVDESFTREDSVKVGGAGWIEDDSRGGAAIAVSGNRCLFSGEPRVEWLPSRLERDNLAVDRFFRMEATLIPEPQANATFEFGVTFYSPKTDEKAPRPAIHFGFDRLRRLRIARIDETRFLGSRRDMDDVDWTSPKQNWRAPAEIRVRLERVQKGAQSQLAFSVYNPATREFEPMFEEGWNFQPVGQNRGVKISFWARGEKKPRFTLVLDDVKILEKRKP